MAGASLPSRKIIEEPSFERSAEALGGSELVDRALEAILDGLRLRPEGFDLVPGYHPLRIAKTKRVERRKGGNIPPLRVWFVIADDGTVLLKYVETIPDPDVEDTPF